MRCWRRHSPPTWPISTLAPHFLRSVVMFVHLLTPVSGILWAHALRPSVLPAGLVTLGARLWLLLLVLWLGTSAHERVR